MPDNNNNTATKQILVGVAITVISALILTLLGLKNTPSKVKPHSNSPNSLPDKEEPIPPVSTSPSDKKNTTISIESTTPKLSDNLATIELELEDFINDWSSNPEQIKDNFDFNLNNTKVSLLGYLDQDSIEDCKDRSNQTTRCIKLSSNISYLDSDTSLSCYDSYHNPKQVIQCLVVSNSGGYYIYKLRLALEPEDIEETQKINRLLYSSKEPLTITVEGKLIFDDENSFKLIDWRIVGYQPYKYE